MESLRIDGARVVLRNEVLETSLFIEAGLIQEIGTQTKAYRSIDARGRLLAPGLIDIHGDAFERVTMPREGVFFPLDIAILETDRQLAANGITTAYHAVTLSWEPGLRHIESSENFIHRITTLSPRLCVENRIQLRWETFAFEALDLIKSTLQGPLLPSVAFNDHTSTTMRSFDMSLQNRPFEHSDVFEEASLDDPRLLGRIEAKLKRSGLSQDEFLKHLGQVWDRRPEVPQKIQEVATLARGCDAPMLSHDDSQIETRDYYRALGAQTSEFPMNTETVRYAKENADLIVLGAPNVLRGGSHLGSGSPNASEMIAEGLCHILASDYCYPAMLGALYSLYQQDTAPVAQLWSLVSHGPAQAMKLWDRGVIEVGKRADLVLVDWSKDHSPAVHMTMSNGVMTSQFTPF